MAVEHGSSVHILHGTPCGGADPNPIISRDRPPVLHVDSLCHPCSEDYPMQLEFYSFELADNLQQAHNG